MNHLMSHTEQDPFEPFHSAATQVRYWRTIAFFWAGMASLTIVCCLLLCFRGPDVIIKDRMSGDPAVVYQRSGEPPITATDASIFVFHMIQLRYGWKSPDVVDDIDTYLMQCHPVQHAFEIQQAQALITPDPKKPSKQVPRIVHWSHSGVRNTVVFPDLWRGIRCNHDAEGAWDCLAHVTIVTQSLTPPFSPQPLQRQAAIIANLLPVPHTQKTPYGLVIGAMREVPAGKEEGT